MCPSTPHPWSVPHPDALPAPHPTLTLCLHPTRLLGLSMVQHSDLGFLHCQSLTHNPEAHSPCSLCSLRTPFQSPPWSCLIGGQYSPLPSGGETHKELAGIWYHLLDKYLLVIPLTIGTCVSRGEVRAKGPQGLHSPQHYLSPLLGQRPDLDPVPRLPPVGQRQTELGASQDQQHSGLSADGQWEPTTEWG